jgi:drug/metabolite transporter (DMT)-like permease
LGNQFERPAPRENRMKTGGQKPSLGATRLAVAALAGQSIFLGYNWVVMKVGLKYSDPWPFVALRTGLGAIALFALLAILRRPLRPCQPLATMLLGLLQTTAMIGLLMWALQTGAAGRVSALVYTMPVWTLMLGWIFLGERVVGLQWLSTLLGVAGLVLVLDPLHLGGTWQSKVLAIASGMAWAASAILVKRINARGSVDVINLTAWQMLYGSIPLIVIALLVPSHSIEWSGSFIAALAYNVIPATAVSWVLWLFILKALPAGVAGISTLATPVIGIASAAIQLGERVSPTEGAGMGCILAALLVLVLRGLRRRGPELGRQGGAEEPEGSDAAVPVTAGAAVSAPGEDADRG